MSDFLTLSIPMGLSVALESPYNSQKELAADYTALVTSALNVQLPVLEKFYDEALIGSGNQWARTSTPDYLSHTGITITDRLNTGLAAILFKRFMSGGVTNTVISATESWDHVLELGLESDDPQLQASSVALKAGGLDMIWAGMIVNSFGVSFSDASQPTFTAELIGSGKFKYMSAVTPTPLVLPAYTAQRYMGTAAAVVCSLDDGTPLDFSSLGRLKSYSWSGNNNAITNDRRAGDPLRTVGDITSGAYPNRLTRGNVRNVSSSFSVYVDGNKREWTDLLNNVHVTNLKWLSKGLILGDGPDSDEFEITIPKACLSNASLSDDGGKLVMSFDVMPLFIPGGGHAGPTFGRVRNGVATLV